MNDSKIKVLLVEPEKYPKEIVIDDSLEAMQEVVGGDIEEYMWSITTRHSITSAYVSMTEATYSFRE